MPAGPKETDMNRFFKTAILSAAVAATTLASLPAANAGDHNWRRHHGHHYRSGNNDLAVAGILGLAAGALVVGLASQPPAYREPAYAPRPQPDRDYPIAYDGYADEYAAAIEPWTADWYQYCSDRYRSFKPRTGTFTGYDGQQHFCVAN
jgi:hypothetical protein